MTSTTTILVALPLFFALAFAQPADPGFPPGPFAIMPDSFPGIVGINTDIDVLLLNYGNTDTTAEVELSFNDWGVTYMGWQPIGTMPFTLLANDNDRKTFSHTFANRAHTCLQAVVTDPGTGGNDNENNDRTQINWEVVHADEDYDMWVPFGNGADEEIIVNGTEILCWKNGTVSPCFPDWQQGEPGADGQFEEDPNPDVNGAPEKLGANEEVVAVVNMPKIPEDGMVVMLQANMNGQPNNVMIQVVKTTIEELLNTPHLCCIKSIKTRVMLESILADALDALQEERPCQVAIKLLRLFVQKAILLECDLTDEEIACIEKAILKIVDAGIMIARKYGTHANKMAYLQEAHFFRRAGLYEAALLEAGKAC
mmetsp:Transcript_105689/g.158207  ORF Transcript_105689/g.158207 Transcript_105689/m.158207 type:complete len:369 (+) Transcript_105689:1-1107(+)